MDDKERRKKLRRQNREERKSREARERVDQGRQFQLGMADRRGETAQNGWRTEHSERSLGRRYDTARVVDPTDRRFTEYKSGRTPTSETLAQLDKDERALERGWSGTWVRVAGVKFGREVEERLARLQRDFPDRFDVATVTKLEKEIAIDRGKELERGGQLSLFDARRLQAERERAREQDARRTRQHEERLARQREAHERDHGREPERDARRGKPWRAPERDDRRRDEREQPPERDLRTVIELHAISFPYPPNTATARARP
ncbi:MAG: hypothetical protein J2P17_01300 [Mycobacterium sp.]|nr:hypothetical protein [Mycobacterium sp.]